MWMICMNLLVFTTVLGMGLYVAQPLFTQYVQSYGVRVRPGKEKPELIAVQPRDSAMLLLCQAFGEFVMRALPGMADRRTIELLSIANYRSSAHLTIYMGIRTIFTGACAIVFMVSSVGNPVSFLLTAPALLLAWLLPNFFLAGRAKKRQKQIVRELPTIIDLLVVCAQAGISLMGAMDKVSREAADSCLALCAELQQLIQEVKVFAKSASSAFRDMADRCCVDELTSLAGALVAAEQKGADISYPLKQQAAAVRDRLKRKKEEEAAKVPVKMVPVIMLFVMPLILAPMLGPAIVTIVIALRPIVGK